MIGVKVGYFGYVIGIIFYSLYVTTIKEREFCTLFKIPQDLFLLIFMQIFYNSLQFYLLLFYYVLRNQKIHSR